MKINHPLSADTWDKKEFSAIISVLKSNLMILKIHDKFLHVKIKLINH